MWTERSELEQNARESWDNLIRTAGWLLVDVDEYIVVGLSLNRLADDVAGAMMIPRVNIEAVRHLGEGE